MKATEVITRLQQLIAGHGDCECVYHGDFRFTISEIGIAEDVEVYPDHGFSTTTPEFRDKVFEIA